MKTIRRSIVHLFAVLALGTSAVGAEFEVKPVSPEQAAEYKLVPTFYKKATLVQGILIATAPDFALSFQEVSLSPCATGPSALRRSTSPRNFAAPGTKWNCASKTFTRW